MKLTKVFGILSFIFLLYGCAATQVALEKKSLDVQTKMSDSIFLDPVSPSKRTVFLQIRNTSDKQELKIQQPVLNSIISKGYKVLDDPELAHYLLQVNILQAGKTDPAAAERALASGFGGAVAGVTAGAAMGSTSGKGLAAAGLIGGAIELVANSLVKDVTYSVITDIQLSEKAKGKVITNSNHQLKQGNSGTSSVQYTEESNKKRYQTRIISIANKINLKFEEALPELKKGLASSIAGLL